MQDNSCNRHSGTSSVSSDQIINNPTITIMFPTLPDQDKHDSNLPNILSNVVSHKPISVVVVQSCKIYIIQLLIFIDTL